METTTTETYSDLKSWRKAKGFNQNEAAAFLGVSVQTYGFMERRATHSRANLLKRVSEKTGITLEALIGAA